MYIIDYMESTEYKIIYYNEKRIMYKEVSIPGKTYSKLITSDGRVAVLFSPGNGSTWSTQVYNSAIEHQMIFDIRIILYVLSQEFKKYYADCEYLYKQFIKSIIPNMREWNIPDVSAFIQLEVVFIPENTMFRIKDYDGSESVDIFEPDKYHTT